MQSLAHLKPCPRLLAVCGALFAALLTALPLTTLRAQAPGHTDWNAGRDLALNERPDGDLKELVDPNPTVHEWLYGHRVGTADNTLILYANSEHVNISTGIYSGYEGFSDAAQQYGIGVHVGTDTYTFSGLETLAPDELFTSIDDHSTDGNNVVRWTCPADGTYSYSVAWRDLDSRGGDGAAGYVVINDVQKFKGTWPNGSGQGAATKGTVTLKKDDTFEVWLNANSSDSSYDSTGTRIVIAPGSTLPSVNTVVPGTANPWLAGQPDGVTAISSDSAPAESPVLVTGLTIQAGTDLTFSTSGPGTARAPGYGLLPADGDSSTQSHAPGKRHRRHRGGWLRRSARSLSE